MDPAGHPDALDQATTGAALAESLFTTAHKLRQKASKQLFNEQVTYERLRLLTFLRDDGDLTMSEMSSRLGVTPRAVTTLATCLESARMLTRQTHPRDRRSIVLHITDAGRQATDQLWDAHRDAMAAVVDKLTPAQKATLHDILDTLDADR
ncbi:MarR family winged helix-turn-helix transcriptional regulator [Kribbella sp. NBC_00359]|uniref:MarR family winged helix-turn-helix transcriptional regulator n=1 Tax=Kribbella sp. NBC_00359 TaxID=2975966 RepID=UPI002E1A50D8